MVSNCGECKQDTQKEKANVKIKKFNKLLKEEKSVTNQFRNEAIKCAKNLEEHKLIIDLEKEYCEKMKYAGDEIDKKNKQLKLHLKRIEQLNCDNKILDKQLNNKTTCLKEYSKKIKSFDEIEKKSEKQIEKMKKEIECLKKENKEKEKEQKRLKEEENQNNANLLAAEKSVEYLKNQIEKKNKYSQKYKKEADKLCEELSKLKKESELFKESTDESNSKKDKYLKELKNIVEKTQKNYEESKREKDILRSQLSKLNENNEKNEESIKNLSREAQKIKKTEEAKRQKLLDEINCLKKDLKKKENDLKISKVVKDYRWDGEYKEDNCTKNKINECFEDCDFDSIENKNNCKKKKCRTLKYKPEEFTILDDFNYSTDNDLYNKILCISDCEFQYFNFLSHTLDKEMLQEFMKQGCDVKLNKEKTLIKNFITEYAYSDKYSKIIEDLCTIKSLVDNIIFVLNKLYNYFVKINILNINAFTNMNDDKQEYNQTLGSYIKIMHDLLDTVVYSKNHILKTGNNVPYKLAKYYKLYGCNNVNITLLFPSLNIIFCSCINFMDECNLIENIGVIDEAKKNLLNYYSNMINYNNVLNNITNILKIKLNNIETNYLQINKKFKNEKEEIKKNKRIKNKI